MDRLKLPYEQTQNIKDNKKYFKNRNSDYSSIRKAITAGFFNHGCRKDAEEGYRSIADNQQVYIHPSSALFDKNP